MTLNITALCIKGLFETLNMYETHQMTLSRTVTSAIMLSVAFLKVILSVVILNVIMLSVVAPSDVEATGGVKVGWAA
jgi:hypothetical protein